MRTPLPAIESLVDAIPSALAFYLQREISGYLDKCGLYYRIFARCKSGFSTSAKMAMSSLKYKAMRTPKRSCQICAGAVR